MLHNFFNGHGSFIPFFILFFSPCRSFFSLTFSSHLYKTVQFISFFFIICCPSVRVLGVLLLQLTGHRDLVTNIEMRTIPKPKQIALIDGQKEVVKEGEEVVKEVVKEVVGLTGVINGATDMIVSVSDDHTARVFYFIGNDLLT